MICKFFQIYVLQISIFNNWNSTSDFVALQFFMYSKRYEIFHDKLCVDFDGKETIQFWHCHKLGGNQKWTHKKASLCYLWRIQIYAVKLELGLKCNALNKRNLGTKGSRIKISHKQPVQE